MHPAHLLQLSTDRESKGMSGIHHRINRMNQTVVSEILQRAKRTHVQISEICEPIPLGRRFRDHADADTPAPISEGRNQCRALAGPCEHKNMTLAIRSSVHQDGAHRIDRG